MRTRILQLFVVFMSIDSISAYTGARNYEQAIEFCAAHDGIVPTDVASDDTLGVMCRLDRVSNYCSMLIQDNGGVKFLGCSRCLFKKNNQKQVCSLTKYGEIQCCCKYRNCLYKILEHVKIGYEFHQKNNYKTCIGASYDSYNSPQWTERRIKSTATGTCSIAISKNLNHNEIEDPIAKVEIVLDAGCHDRENNVTYEVLNGSGVRTFSTRSGTILCCSGNMCNVDLYRQVGLQLILSSVYVEDEKYVLKSFKKERIRNLKTRVHIPNERSQSVMKMFGSMVLCLIIWSVVKLRKLEERQPKREKIYKHQRVFKNRVDEMIVLK